MAENSNIERWLLEDNVDDSFCESGNSEIDEVIHSDHNSESEVSCEEDGTLEPSTVPQHQHHYTTWERTTLQSGVCTNHLKLGVVDKEIL